jgi:hypothetical protein
VAHTCNPSYSGGRNQEDCGSKPAQQIVHEILSLKTLHKNRTGGVTQGEDPEFKPQLKKKKELFSCRNHLTHLMCCWICLLIFSWGFLHYRLILNKLTHLWYFWFLAINMVCCLHLFKPSVLYFKNILYFYLWSYCVSFKFWFKLFNCKN